MPNFRKIFRYMRHYGITGTLGLIREKLLVDPKRFSPKIKRELPSFPEEYLSAAPNLSENDGKPYTVLYLIHYFYPERKGGTERFTLNIAKEAERHGARPVVLVLDANESESRYPYERDGILYRFYEYDGIKCIGFRHKRAPLGLYYKRISGEDEAMRGFARFLVESEGVNVVHATYPQPFTPFLLECYDMKIPYVATCTDFCMMCHYATMVDDKGAFCGGSECGEKCKRVCKTYGVSDFGERLATSREVLSKASLVTVPSKFVARVLSNEFSGVGFLPVNHGISESFKYKEGRTRVKNFVYAGTISQLKGIHLLISAFNRLSGEGLTLKIYGAGDDKYLQKLKALASDRVEFFGAVPGDKMPQIYSEADCVIVPSMWYETYNFVLREAANCGALVIASDIGAMSEAITNGENGYLFRPADEEDLYEKMKLALEFDFDNYKPMKYPTLKSEGEFYHKVYKSLI